MNCHCGSGKDFKDCCGVFLDYEQKPSSAEQLMRSRYSAFVVGAIDYIYDTHAPETQNEVSKDEIMTWSQSSDWMGLEIVDTQAGQASDNDGIVEFIAKYKTDGELYSHHERATFKKIKGDWFFFDGRIVRNNYVNEMKNVGRNDPCPCGSGKKYKKCCLLLNG